MEQPAPFRVQVALLIQSLVVLSTVTKLVSVSNVGRNGWIANTDIMLVTRISRRIMADQSLTITTGIGRRRTRILHRRRTSIASTGFVAGILGTLALLKTLTLCIARQVAASSHTGVVCLGTEVMTAWGRTSINWRRWRTFAAITGAS